MPNVNIDIYAKTHGAPKEIKEVDKALDGMGGAASRGDSKLGGLWKQFAGGILAAKGLETAIRDVVKFMGSCITEAGDQETAINNLQVALESTGREVDLNTQHFKTFAEQLQNTTIFADDQIMAAQALMLQLTDLDNKGIDAATKGALGLASTFKMDLNSATNLVAKALAGNYGALSRYGISVSDLNTDEEKRATLLDKLGVLYSRAEGETNTYQGAMAQLKNTFGDLKEGIGNTIVKNEDFIKLIKDTKDRVREFVESGQLEEWANKAARAIKILFESIDTLKIAISGLIKGGYLGYINDMTNKLIGMDDKLKQLERGAIQKAIEFRDSLKVLKPSMEQIRIEFEKGEKHRETWIKQMQEMDAQLAANKDGYLLLKNQIADYLGIKKQEVIDIEDVEDVIEDQTGAVKNQMQAVIDFGPPLDTWAEQMAEVESAYKATKTAIEENTEYINTTAVPSVEAAAGAYASAMADMESSTHDVGEENKTVTTNLETDWCDASLTIKDDWILKLSDMLTGAQGFQLDIGSVWEGIKTNIGGALTSIKDNFFTVWEGIKGDIGSALGSIKDNVLSVWEGIKGDVGSVLEGIKENVTSVISGLTQPFTDLKDAVTGIWDDIKGSIGSVMDGIKENVTGIIDELKQPFIDLYEKGKEAAASLVDSLGSAVGSISEGLKSLATLNPSGIVAGAIAGVIGGLLAGLTGGGLSKAGMNEHLYRIHDRLQEIKDFMFIDIRTWVIQAWTTLFNTHHTDIMGKFLSLQLLGQNRNAELRTIRRLIKDQMLGLIQIQADNLNALYKFFTENTQFGQQGLDTMVNRPTLFLTGERGSERVTVTPQSGGRSVPGGAVNVTFNIHAMDAEGVQRILETKGIQALENIFRRNVGGITQRLSYEVRKY